MFVPFVFTLDERPWSKEYAQGDIFYIYADACIAYNWPIIAPERYFSKFSIVEDTFWDMKMKDFVEYFCMRKIPTTEEMSTIKTYPILQVCEDSIITKYCSKADCLNDLLANENEEFEHIIGELLDKITNDFQEKPEGILCFEILPKSLIAAADKRGIPLIFQLNGLLRQPIYKLRQFPHACQVNCMSLKKGFEFENIQSMYKKFLSDKVDLPMLSRKGILRLFFSEQYIRDIHNIDNEPEYDIGVLHNSLPAPLHNFGQETMPDEEMSLRAVQRYGKVLIRARPGFQQYAETDAFDNSPSCFHFCCKCKHVVGSMTKGVFEAMLVGRIAHEYGSFIFHSYCNNGIEDESKGLAPLEFINFIIFELWAPLPWLTDPGHLRLSISESAGKELYMRGFNYFTRDISKEDLKFYFMTSGREYRLGDPLYFSFGHLPHQYASYYCTNGLYIPEASHTWSEGEMTEFEFDLVELPEEDLVITIVLHSIMYDSTQADSLSVRCEVNGHMCGNAQLFDSSKYLQFTIPKSWVASKLIVSFFYENPKIMQVGEEAKCFAVAFEAIRVSKVGQNPFEQALQESCNRLQTELTDILSSKVFKIIVKPIWKISAKLKGK